MAMLACFHEDQTQGGTVIGAPETNSPLGRDTIPLNLGRRLVGQQLASIHLTCC